MKGKKALVVTKAKRTGAILAAVLALTLTAIPARQARADDLDLTKDMYLDVTVAEQAAELKEAGLVVDLYLVAEAKKMKNFDTYEFDASKTSFAGLADDVRNPDVSNDDWRDIAQKAAKIVLEGSSVTPQLTGQPRFDEESEKIKLPKHDESKNSGGLYLVLPRASKDTDKAAYLKKQSDGSLATVVISKGMKYTFSPQLVAVPGKPQYDSNNSYIVKNNTADSVPWSYTVPMTLKVAYEEQETELEIVKSIDTYETKDPATFVFDVEATFEGKNIYSNVETIVFDKPGMKVCKVKGLPVGAEVTVTEIYEGAVYELDTTTTAKEQKITLAADTLANKVEFDNDYNNRYHGGGSVKNEFTKTTTDKGNGVYDPTAKIKDEDQLEPEKDAE